MCFFVVVLKNEVSTAETCVPQKLNGSNLSLPMGQRCSSCSGQGSSDYIPHPAQIQGCPWHVTSPRPCKALLCTAILSVSGPAAEVTAPGGVSPREMKTALTVTGIASLERSALVSDGSFFSTKG